MIGRSKQLLGTAILTAGLVLAYASPVLAVEIKTYTGVQASIEKYLCAPSAPGQPVAGQGNRGNAFFGNTGAPTNTVSSPSSGDLFTCINKLYRFAIVVAVTVAMLFVAVAGYLYMSADGSAEQTGKAKTYILNVVVALLILLGGNLLLKTINPDLIQFHPVNSRVTFDPLEAPGGEPPAGTPLPPAATVTTPLSGASGATVAQLQAAGCTIVNQTRVRNELPNLVAPMWQKLVSICQTASAAGFKPNVSSTVRRESAGSYHSVGCAVDFSDGIGDGFFDYNTKQGRPAGKALYQAVQAAGIAESRIDPGDDRKQSFHLHIDLGTSCPVRLK